MKRWLSAKRMMILCLALLVSLMLAVPAVHAENSEIGQTTEAGSSETGNAGTADSYPGSGKTGSGETGSGETGSGETGSGETGSGETGSGETGSGETGSGETGSGETGSGETGSGETGSGETGSGETGSGETGSGETGSGETGSGETGSGETGSTSTVPATMICRHIGPDGSLFSGWKKKNANEHVRTCSFCHMTETRPHNWGPWTKVKGNLYKHTCLDCLAEETVEHTHVAGKPVRENVHYATCTRDGWYESVTYCTICGEELSRKKIPVYATGHSYMVTGRTIIRLYYECKYCGEEDWTYNEHSKNLIPGLVRDEWDRNYGYTSDIVETHGQRVLILTPHESFSTPDAQSTAYSVFLRPSDVRKWIADYVDAVILRVGNTDLKIRLYNITPDWFPVAKIDYYVFTLGLEEGGARVTVAAQTGEEKVPANFFSGVTLMRNSGSLEITENGVY